MARQVYILMTEKKVKAYTTHSRAWKVFCRATRMKVKVEMMVPLMVKGDPYKSKPMPDWSNIY